MSNKRQKTEDEILYENILMDFRDNNLANIQKNISLVSFISGYRQEKVFKLIYENIYQGKYGALDIFLDYATVEFYKNTDLSFLNYINGANLDKYSNIKKNLHFFVKHIKIEEFDQIMQYKKIINYLDKNQLASTILFNHYGFLNHSSKHINKMFNKLNSLELIPSLETAEGKDLLNKILQLDEDELLLNLIVTNSELFPSILYKKSKNSEQPILKIISACAKKNLKILDDFDMIDWNFKDGKGRNFYFYCQREEMLSILLKNISIAQKDNFNKSSLYYLNLNLNDEIKLKNLSNIFSAINDVSLTIMKDLEPDIRKYLFSIGFRQKQKKWVLEETENNRKVFGSKFINSITHDINAFYQKLMLHKVIDLSVWDEVEKPVIPVKRRVLL